MALWFYALINFHFSGNTLAYYPLRLGTSVLLYWIGYQGLFRYRVVQERILLRDTLASQGQPLSIIPTATSVKNSFMNEKHRGEFEKVRLHIVENQRYLDPNFQLELLATEVAMSPSHLSKLINAYSDSNFSDFINSFRVSRSKILLKDLTFSNYTIVAIGLECGFNSRSTFYSAFKKFTTQTPSEFKSSS
jgi:AraC-like DNA-binding protein